MNTRLLRRIAAHITEEPKRLIMGDFIQWKDESSDGKVTEYDHRTSVETDVTPTTHHFAACGTAACLAGWATVLTLSPKKAREVDAEEYGRTKLRLTEQQSDKLFFVWHWPQQFRTKYELAKTPRSRASIAVARIEHFIKTKGKE